MVPVVESKAKQESGVVTALALPLLRIGAANMLAMTLTLAITLKPPVKPNLLIKSDNPFLC